MGKNGPKLIDSAEFNERINCKSLKEIFPKIWWFGFNITAVYILEFLVIGCFSERVSQYVKGDNPVHYFERYMFTCCTLCYTIGVAIARSSLYLYRVKRVEIFTVLQLMLSYIWFCEVCGLYIGGFEMVRNCYIILGGVIISGLMGGASYINVFNEIVNSNTIKITQKELAISICTLFYDAGVIFSGLAGMVMNHFLFHVE